MARIEAAKQQNFHKNTLDVWFDEMSRLGWDDKKLMLRYRAVLMMPQVRREITFDDFIHAPSIDHQGEVYGDAIRVAERIIQHRREQLVKQKVPRELIEKEGLIELSTIFDNELQRKKEELVQQRQEELKKLRTEMAKFGEKHIREIYADCVNKKLIEPDDVFERDWTLLLWYLRNRILIVEPIINQHKKRMQKGK